MTDQTPRTEAGRNLLATHAGFRHRILAIEAEAAAQARAEGLDVEVLARAFDGHVWAWLDWTQEDNAPADRKAEALHNAADILASRYRAILAGETDQ